MDCSRDSFGEINVYRQQTKILDRLLQKTDFPLYATIELTSRCNLKCPHCYMVPSNINKELKTSEVLDVFDQMAEMGVLILTLTGGEPSTRSDFFKLIQAAVDRRFVVILKTNSALLDENDVRKMYDIGLFEINVSLYHCDRAKHDAFVGQNGAWERAVSALRVFKSLGGRVRVASMVMSWNVDDALNIEQFFLNEGWPHTFDFRILPRKDGDSSPSFQQADPPSIRKVARQIGSLIETVTAARTTPDPEGIVCGSGRVSICIQSNGDVTPCLAMSSVVLGNIRDQSLKDIWSESPLRKIFSALKWGDSQKCLGCKTSAYCHRCPATALFEHGDISQCSSQDCRLAKVWRDIRTDAAADG